MFINRTLKLWNSWKELLPSDTFSKSSAVVENVQTTYVDLKWSNVNDEMKWRS